MENCNENCLIDCTEHTYSISPHISVFDGDNFWKKLLDDISIPFSETNESMGFD